MLQFGYDFVVIRNILAKCSPPGEYNFFSSVLVSTNIRDKYVDKLITNSVCCSGWNGESKCDDFNRGWTSISEYDQRLTITESRTSVQIPTNSRNESRSWVHGKVSRKGWARGWRAACTERLRLRRWRQEICQFAKSEREAQLVRLIIWSGVRGGAEDR